MAMQQPASRVGKVKWFSRDLGYGFLIDEQTGEEIFVHATGLAAPPETLATGMRLQFVLGWRPDSGKRCALRVRSCDG
jgi:cold shock protein